MKIRHLRIAARLPHSTGGAWAAKICLDSPQISRPENHQALSG
jgi:hypothetical protein